MNDLTLARTAITYGGRPGFMLIARGGLHYITSNGAPHFSLTGEIWNPRRKNDCEACGCLHDEILRAFPQFSDLAALHLSTIDGVPMHSEANGWYHLAGALPGNAGEKYHAGNSKQNFPKPDGAPRREEWDTTDYREPTPDECLESFARNARVDIETARMVRDSVIAEWKRTRERMEKPETFQQHEDAPINWTAASWGSARAWFKRWIEEQRPRWNAEAEACIERHGLKVYGDKWERANGEVL